MSLADLNDAFSMIGAMERADQASSVRLIRLVDGVETWEGCAGDERQEFDFRDDAAEWVADRRREVRARALVRAMKAWRDLALAAAAAARPASSPQDGGEALREARAEVANLQGKLAASEAERGKMADTAVAGWVEHNRLRWDAEERAGAAEADLAEARAVLRRVEWLGSDGRYARCPCCRRAWAEFDGKTYSHAPDCALAAALVPPPRGATGPSVDPDATPSEEGGHGRG